MLEINAVGKPCPIPVIETKKAIRSLAGKSGVVSILVDNEIAQQNIEKLCNDLNFAYTKEETSDNLYKIIIKVETNIEISADKNESESLVVAIGNRCMGKGNDELGEILMKSFLFSLTELTPVPKELLLFNSGVHLVCSESTVIESLRDLEKKGTKISSCGTCLDYYQLHEEIKIGNVTNMYGIVEAMQQADKLINL